MGYTVVKSFERGIDTRRMIDTTEPGALLDALNCHVTRGGELEKRAAFVVIGTFPANTVGMYATVLGEIHTWGTDASPSGTLPPNTTYHSIPHLDDEALVKILSVEEFNGKLYVIALYDNGDIYHWYDDELLYVFVPPPPPPPDPDLPDPTEPPTGVLQPGMARTSFWLEPYPGTTPPAPSTDTVGIINATLFKPTWTDWIDTSSYITLIDTDTVDPTTGMPYQSAPQMIDFDPSYITIASLVMDKINEMQATTEVMATTAGNKVTVWKNEISADWNGWYLGVAIQGPTGSAIYLTNNPGTYSGTLTFFGGFDPPPPGTRRDIPAPFDAPPPVPLNNGTFVLAHNSKLYCTQRSKLNFSANEDAVRWDTDAFGAGSIDHTKIGEGTPILLSLADFGGDLAVFGARDIFLWHMDPDPRANFKRQVLHRAGTIAPHSTCAFGESEVMYLDRSGIRSLRSRSGIDAAFAADIGNNIDTLVLAKIKELTADQLLDNVWADIEPRSGRLWMALYDKIYVLSYFPNNGIAAWTVHDASEFPVDMMNSSGDNLFWRSGDSLICYGDLTGDEYDDTEAYARLPYIDGSKIATFKNWTGIDIAAFGTWQVKASFDPTLPTALDLIANIIKSTYAQQKIAMNGESPAVSLELRTSYVGPARLGNATLHYTDSTAD